MILATYHGTVYKTVELLHVLAAIVGFGAVFLNGIYAARARRLGGREGLAIAEVNAFVTNRVAEYVIYLVFVLGIVLVALGKPVVKFSQPWVGAAMTLYIVALGLVHGVLVPGERKMRALMAELAELPPGSGTGAPPQAAEYDRLYQRTAAVGGTLDVILVVIVYLMVFHPGANF